jgi:hypothetical protein
MGEQLTIRTLTVDDNRRLTRMLGKLIKTADGEWLQHLVAASSPAVGQPMDDEAAESVKYARLFGEIATWLLEVHETDIEQLFASLLNKSVEEYRQLPFDTDVVIVEQIKEAPEFKSFFSKACAVFKLKSKFADIISSAKRNFATLTS